jgi:signal transduction histidine kinase
MPEGGKLTVENANAYLDDDYARDKRRARRQYVMIAVTDTGAGMPKEVVAKHSSRSLRPRTSARDRARVVAGLRLHEAVERARQDL